MSTQERSIPDATPAAACPHLDQIAWPSPEIAECPFPYYRQLRDEARVYKYPGRDQYLLSHWEDIVYVAEHPDVFIQPKVDRHPLEPVPNPDNEPLSPTTMVMPMIARILKLRARLVCTYEAIPSLLGTIGLDPVSVTMI